jgi:hypothetical protein
MPYPRAVLNHPLRYGSPRFIRISAFRFEAIEWTVLLLSQVVDGTRSQLLSARILSDHRYCIFFMSKVVIQDQRVSIAGDNDLALLPDNC